jgi:hypothetical protein
VAVRDVAWSWLSVWITYSTITELAVNVTRTAVALISRSNASVIARSVGL